MTEITPDVRKKRKAIIEDVLERLQLGAMTVKSGHYMLVKDDYHRNAESILAKGRGASAQDVIDVIEANCQVCARGAVLMSKIRKYDAVTVGAIANSGGEPACSQHDTTKLLDGIFSAKDLALIEAAFERTTGLDGSRLWTYDELSAAANFGSAAGNDPGVRLAAIMNNMLANDTVFVPSKP